MSPEKVRIYDLARELGTPNKVLINLLKDKLNISVKSHSSTISQDVADKLRAFTGSDSSSKKQPSAPEPTPESKSEESIKPETIAEITSPQTNQTKLSEPATEPKKEPKPAPMEAQPAERKVQQAQPHAPTRTNAEQSSGDRTPSKGYVPDRSVHKRPDMYKQQRDLNRQHQKPGQNPQQQSTEQNQSESPHEKFRKPFGGDKPFGISGNKYRLKPSTPAPGAGAKQQQRGKPTGRKPQYFKHSTQHNIKTDETIQGKTDFKPAEKPDITTVESIDQTAETKTLLKEETAPATKTERQPGERFEKRHHVKPDDRPRDKRRDRPDDRPRERSTDRRFEPRDKKDIRPVDRPDIRYKEKPKQEDNGPIRVNSATTDGNKPAAKPGVKHGHKKELPKKKDKYQDLKPITEIFKKKKPPKKEVVEEIPTEVCIKEAMIIAELAKLLKISAAEIIKELMKAGVFATINETISEDLAKEVTEKLGYQIIEEIIKEKEPEIEDKKEDEEKESTIDKSKLEKRAPIVTILGHVDHGKTTLLDSIRASKHKLVDAEVGGITQSIGAYTVEYNNNKIVFIDTPGHQAFTAMRARGAQATDIAILIVAADDGVMPQTVEAINHAKAAEVPIIVAINKIDKSNADPDRILQQLTEHNLIPEEWGGETVTVKISAFKGENIDDLLEMITLVAEMQELKADSTAKATGVVIEAELDKGKGAVARVLVQNGTLYIGDFVVVGSVGGKVRALINDHGERVVEAGPSTPVEILGLGDVPNAGDTFAVVESDKELKQIVSKRKEEDREKRLSSQGPIKLQKDTIFTAKQKKKTDNEIKELNIIIKSDTDGSAKAVETALQELKSKEIKVKLIHSGVGDISEADVMLAATSDAIIIGFGVKEDPNALRVSAEEGVSIRTYEIIYQISEDIEKTMLGLLKPELKEIELGVAEVRDLFTVGKNLVIAGCYVLDGKVVRNRTATVLRENKEIYKGNLDNLKRFKDDAKEVASGYECGISFNKFNDLQKGDLIKVTTMVEIERESLN
ncbi:MAG: translation initiation factor IF-2 [Cyanobacteriota bacterium]